MLVVETAGSPLPPELAPLTAEPPLPPDDVLEPPPDVDVPPPAPCPTHFRHSTGTTSAVAAIAAYRIARNCATAVSTGAAISATAADTIASIRGSAVCASSTAAGGRSARGSATAAAHIVATGGATAIGAARARVAARPIASRCGTTGARTAAAIATSTVTAGVVTAGRIATTVALGEGMTYSATCEHGDGECTNAKPLQKGTTAHRRVVFEIE